MANYATLKSAIQQVVKTNGNNEITGALLQQSLLAMINSLGGGFQYMGVATPATNPGTPDQNVFYIAGPGTYPNFNSVIVDDGNVAIFKYNGSWTAEYAKIKNSDVIVSVPFTIAESCNSTGRFVANADARRTDYVEIVKGTKIVAYDGSSTLTAYRACNFYDENKQWISNIVFDSTGIKTIILGDDNIPVNAKYFVSCTLLSLIDDCSVEYNALTKLDERVTALEESVGEYETINQDYKTFQPAIITTSASVNSGSRLDKTIDLRQYVGQIAKVTITKTGGSSTEFGLYNSDNDYWIGNAFAYGTPCSFVVNDILATLRILGTSVENSSASFSISIVIEKRYGLSQLAQKTLYSEQQYTINAGYYINGNNSVMPTNPTAFSNAGSVSGTIKAGDTLVLKGTGSGKIITLFAFYNANKQRIMVSGSGNTSNLDALQVIAPENSAYFIYNSYPYNSQNDFVIVRNNFTIEQIDEKNKENSIEIANNRADINSLMWVGKRVVCFGDSITEFADSALKTYPDYIAEITKATVINVGVGGTRLACRTTPTATPANANQAYADVDCPALIDAAVSGDFSKVDAGVLWLKNNASDDNTQIINRLKAIDWSTIDIVTIFIGTNDWGGSQNYGTTGDTVKTTTLGAVNYIITTLLTQYKHLKLYWFTPTVRWLASSLAQRTDENWGGVAVRDGRTLEQFSDGIANEVRLNSIPICDMYHTLGWNKANFSQYFNDTDGTHPIKGFPEIARKFASFITANRTF